MSRRKLPAIALIFALLGGGAVAANQAGLADRLGIQLPAASSSAPQGAAADALEMLPVKGKAAKTGYSRDQFGPTWADVDRNGCDTRNDMLARDLREVAIKPGRKPCVVISGVRQDPYSGTEIIHQKGNSKVDIDHVVALGQAWVSGAQQIAPEQRKALANDPENLVVVSGSDNRAKGDREASAWLPPNKASRCSYVAAQIHVKTKYKLSVTVAEKVIMTRILAGCPGQKLVTAAGITG